MSAKRLTYADNMGTNGSNAPAEAALGVLGAIPLVILLIEAVIGGILLLVSVLFFATIYFAFVGFVLIYVVLWIAILLNALGVAISMLTLLAGRRSMTGKVFGLSGLLIHAVLLGAGVYGVANIHSYLAKNQQVRQPAAYSFEVQERRPPQDRRN